MRTTFEVRGKSYRVELERAGKPEGETREVFAAIVEDPGGSSVKGQLKLTQDAIDLATERAGKEGGSADEWILRGCMRSLAAELLIRKLQPDFSFVVDHRWVGR